MFFGVFGGVRNEHICCGVHCNQKEPSELVKQGGWACRASTAHSGGCGGARVMGMGTSWYCTGTVTPSGYHCIRHCTTLRVPLYQTLYHTPGTTGPAPRHHWACTVTPLGLHRDTKFSKIDKFSWISRKSIKISWILINFMNFSENRSNWHRSWHR